ncbi:MAG: LysM peptidoglycan-binding domain-containing protein [Thermodesulfobacteriota bacterium]
MRIFKSVPIILLVLGLALPAAHSIEFPPEPPKKLIVHTVKSGEELHLLAGYYYLDCRQWEKIYQANLGSINNPNKIYPGQQLYIYVDQDWKPPFDLDAYVSKWRPYLLSGTAP